MRAPIFDPAIEDYISDVVQIGSACDLDGMERLCSAEQTFLVLTPEGKVLPAGLNHSGACRPRPGPDNSHLRRRAQQPQRSGIRLVCQ